METEEQARARILSEVLADPAFDGAPQVDIDFEVNTRVAAWRTRNASTDDTGMYNWLDDLPPEYQPPGRTISGASPGGGGGSVTYTGRGLVDSRGGLVRNPDGTTKVLYGPTDVQSIWRGIGFEERKQISRYM